MKQLICSTVVEWSQSKKSGLLYYFSDSENKTLISLNIILKINRLSQKVLRNSSIGTGQKTGTSFPKGLRNSSMGTGQKMGTTFPKGLKKFVYGYRVKEICQLIQGEIVNCIYDKNDCFYNNLRGNLW